MRQKRSSCRMRVWEAGKHADSEIKRAVGIKIAVDDNKRWNIAIMIKRIKTVIQ